jgi:glycosyltransferase involved in cell wall biosynthesis
MNKTPTVSIIVPVYGVEEYLHQCIDSILGQSLSDIEIILVDDGSKDGCPRIIDEYAKKDNRIIAVHQQNQGYGRAVNHGIELANGEYIGIVEPDDWIEPDMYNDLYIRAKEVDADIVKGPFYRCWTINDRIYRESYSPAGKAGVQLPKVFDISKSKLSLFRHPSIWTGIYRLSFIRQHNIKMPEKDKGRYADYNWMFETLVLAKTISWLNTPFYNWRPNNPKNSTAKNDNPDDRFNRISEIEEFLNNHSEKHEQIKEWLYKLKYCVYFHNFYMLATEYKKQCLRRIYNEFKKMDYDIIAKSGLFNAYDKKLFKDTQILSEERFIRYYYPLCLIKDSVRKITVRMIKKAGVGFLGVKILPQRKVDGVVK